jgi:hypothetical protein
MASCAVVGEGPGRTWCRPKGDRIKQQAGDLRDNCATLARFEGDAALKQRSTYRLAVFRTQGGIERAPGDKGSVAPARTAVREKPTATQPRRCASNLGESAPANDLAELGLTRLRPKPSPMS